jgi:hypothetical protein
MIEMQAQSFWVDDNDVELDEPYFELKGGARIMVHDVEVADWKDYEDQIKAAFAVARAGTGDLICLVAGDDNIWLSTTDKINSGPFTDAK